MDVEHSGDRYRIVVRGRLPSTRASVLDGARIRTAGGRTVVTGRLVDQTHLYGLVDGLRDLGAELLSLRVERADGRRHP